YGKQFLNFSNRFLRYSGEASYPVYILHQTVIVAIGFYVVQLSTNILVKYLAILFSAILITFVLYDLLVKRTNLTRSLFGMRLIKKQAEVPLTSKEETAVLMVSGIIGTCAIQEEVHTSNVFNINSANLINKLGSSLFCMGELK
uniref:hypothetical protein n=1 Tax=Sulfitobacter sp. TaxID=1903071 RepID=UPI002729B53A